ncbi:DUF4340 domain-containing protein, partial [Myxococcota bacterium]|nr:DUF4340 domain-containing protein [Myxococcota bacterium]
MDLVKRRLLNMAFFTLLGVGALGLFFWQQNKSEVDEQSEKVSKRVLTEFQPSSVNVLSLQTPKNNYKLQREESGEWFIVEPEKTLADSAVIDSIVQQLSTLSFESMMGESQKEGEPEPSLDLALFSLAPPLFTLTLEGPAMSPQTLQVGKVNRFDGSVYAKSAASEQVGLVLKSVHYLVDKNLYALREKRVVLFEPADVQALDIKFEKSEGDYRLERVGEFFEVIKDGRFRVDQAQIDGILNELKILKAQLFVRDSIQDKNPNKQNAVQKYGLDKPVVSISMEFAGDRKSVTLAFSQLKLEKVTR